MKTAPSTVFDFILAQVSERYMHYHVLPKSQLAGVDMILSVLEKMCVKYKMQNGTVPVLFLDGMDLVAIKHDPILCKHIVTHAKLNMKVLKIVIISSDGTIMPLLGDLSAMNRAVIYEVGDITDVEAMNYLTKNQIAKDVARQLVSLIGSRIVHLESCVYLKNYLEKVLEEKVYDVAMQAQTFCYKT